MFRMSDSRTLSISPYYGGKGRMAHFIADRLDYGNTDIFVTPFGGMCRVLLNKPRHSLECYNDYSSALCALMRVLSEPDSAQEFINRLYSETEFSRDEFDKQKAIFDRAEQDLEEQETIQACRLLRQELKIARPRQLLPIILNKKILSELTASTDADLLDLDLSDVALMDQKKLPDSTIKSLERYDKAYNDNAGFRQAFEPCLNNLYELWKVKNRQGYLPRSADIGEPVSDMDLAIATYVVFQQSRDGMGQAWSEHKFKDTEQYLKQVLKLYDCAERLEGVEIFQIDALDFFRHWETPYPNTIRDWLNNPRVMMYCDPSYISVESERELLKGIDIANTDSLSEAIRQKYADKKFPKNLGEVYARSFGYDEQEQFLRCIQQAKCHLVVSNYDLELYNKYLNESTGWRREEFLTTTGVGSKADNSRLEVIWYNY